MSLQLGLTISFVEYILEFFLKICGSYLVSGTDVNDIVNLFPTPYIEMRQERARIRKYTQSVRS